MRWIIYYDDFREVLSWSRRNQISDHQQSVARPLRGAILIPPALLVVADLSHVILYILI